MPYRVHVEATICDRTFYLYNETIIIQGGKLLIDNKRVCDNKSHFVANAIDVPIISNIVRNSAAAVNFDISFGSTIKNDTIFEVNYYNYAGLSFDEV